MKKWYCEYLHISKERKISEKTLFRRIAVMVVGMLFCVFSMGFTAYAYFSCSITSGASTLQSATYDVNVYVENIVAGTGAVLIDDASTLAVGCYRITIQASGTATTGYSKVLIGEKQYFTKQMSPNESISFVINCFEATNISVVANWGTYSGNDFLDLNAPITIGTEGSSISDEQEAEVDDNQESTPDDEAQEGLDDEEEEASEEEEFLEGEEQESSNSENPEVPGTDEEVDGADSTEQGAEQETESSVTQNE